MEWITMITIETSSLSRLLCMALLAAVLVSCGQDHGTFASGNAAAVVSGAAGGNPSNYVALTADEYGLQTPNFYYTTDNESFWSIQADIATDVHDPDFKCVIRIDVPKVGGILPDLAKTFTIGAGSGQDVFPGEFLVFDGHQSVAKKVMAGTITFASQSPGFMSGSFDVTLTDYDSVITPPPEFRLAGSFGFTMNSSGPADPLPAETYPVQGKIAYDTNCASCHSLGKYDGTAEGATDLSMQGGGLPQMYPGEVPEHQGVMISAEDLQPLRIFLNAM